MKSKYRNILTLILIISSFTFMSADFPQWDVPADKAAVKNPVENNKIAVEEGATLFKTQCTACHGALGKGDGAIASANLTADAFQAQSDGAIFYKITTGRGVMPAFKSLEKEKVWKIIHYLRTFGKKTSDEVKKHAELKITLIENDNADNEVLAHASIILKNGKEIVADNVKLGLYVKRYFGLLPLGDNKYTDSNGNLKVSVPSDLPGDADGNLTIVSRVEDIECTPVELTNVVKWGVSTAETEWGKTWETERALWRTNDRLPFWDYILYFGITIGIWIGIIYVLLLVRKIKKLS